MGGRTQSGWKVSYLCKSIACDLLSSSSICSAVGQQVCRLQGHKSTCTHSFPLSQQPFSCKSTIFALFLHWFQGGGWCWAVTNSGQDMTHLQACEMVSRWLASCPPHLWAPTTRTVLGAWHRPLLPVCSRRALDTALITLFCNTLWATGSFLESLFHAGISTL